jgi:hypothetical protein
VTNQVNDWCLSTTILGSLIDTFSRYIENFVEIDRRSVISVSQHVISSHTDLTKVTRMVLIHEDAMVMLTSSITAPTGMLSVLSNTSMSHLDVSSLLA